MTIVVATDFSQGASHAMRIAGLLAKAVSLPLHLVHVSEDPRAPLVIRTSEERLLVEDRRKLNEAAEALRRDYGVPVAIELEAGRVVDQVCAVAERHVADLLVIGSPPGSHSLVGSTAEKIVRSVRVPVLAVRSPAALETWLTTDRPLRILVGSDLGAASREAEGFLTLLDRAGPIDVQVVCVADPVGTHARYDLPPPYDMNVLEPAAAQLALRDLTAQGDAFAWKERRHPRVIASTARADTHLAILGEHADLVVVGARKRSWLAEAWQGSVASGVLRTSPTSVVCVPRGLATAKLPLRARPRIVVAATDFSALGDEAVRTALSMIDPGATLHLVHVLTGVLENEAEERIAAHRQLRRRVPEELEGRQVHVDVLVGHPAEAITGFARRVGADSLCLGSHGRSGAGALVLGSTSHEVVAHADIPVLIVPPARE